MNSRRLEQRIGPCGQRRGVCVREMTWRYQRHSSQAHRPQRPRRGPNVPWMLWTHQDTQHICLHVAHDPIAART